MNKHFILAFRLRNTYRVNAIIYSLKSLPVVRKLLPSSLYASRGLKRFADIIIPEGGFNTVAAELVIARLKGLLAD